MVQALFCVEPKNEPELLKLGVKDSKKLSAIQRTKIMSQIVESDCFKWRVVVSPAAFISHNMSNKASGLNLNQIEHKNIVELLRMEPKFNGHVFLDSIGGKKNCERVLGPRLSSIHVQHTIDIKADTRYPVVSAASIVAKVIRDQILDEIEQLWRLENPSLADTKFGCGYPSGILQLKLLKYFCKLQLLRLLAYLAICTTLHRG